MENGRNHDGNSNLANPSDNQFLQTYRLPKISQIVFSKQQSHQDQCYSILYSWVTKYVDYQSATPQQLRREHNQLLYTLHNLNKQLQTNLKYFQNRKVKTQQQQQQRGVITQRLVRRNYLNQDMHQNLSLLNMYRHQYKSLKKKQIHLKVIDNSHNKDTKNSFLNLSRSFTVKQSITTSIEKAKREISDTKKYVRQLTFSNKAYNYQFHKIEESVQANPLFKRNKIQEEVGHMLTRKLWLERKNNELADDCTKLREKLVVINQDYPKYVQKYEKFRKYFQCQQLCKKLKQKQHFKSVVEKKKNQIITKKQKEYLAHLLELEKRQKNINNIQENIMDAFEKNQEAKAKIRELQAKQRRNKMKNKIKLSPTQCKQQSSKQNRNGRVSIQNLIQSNSNTKISQNTFIKFVETQSNNFSQNALNWQKDKIEKVQSLSKTLKSKQNSISKIIAENQIEKIRQSFTVFPFSESEQQS